MKINKKSLETNSKISAKARGVIELLLADHRLIRNQMKKVQSQKATPRERSKAFAELTATVKSHVKAEEEEFLTIVKANPKFQDLALEGYEEHRVHETVLSGIRRVIDSKRRHKQMHIFCEILEHHLDEEEEKIFPRFKKYFSKSTRESIGVNFLKTRKRTSKGKSMRGAARYALGSKTSL